MNKALFLNRYIDKIFTYLYIAYKIYAFVANKRKTYIKEEIEDFIFYADELMSYGIYKILLKEKQLNNLENSYFEIFEAIKVIVNNEKNRLENFESTYSHNEYFKSFRIDE